MDKVHPLSFPMVLQSLDVKKDPSCHCEKVKNHLILKYHIYLCAICALIYLANCTHPNIICLSIY